MAVLWENYGPYHLARLAAFQEAADWDVLGVEVADRSRSYAWKRAESGMDITTLFKGELAEDVSPIRVFFAIRKWMKRENICILFTASYWPGYSIFSAVAAKTFGAKVVLMGESHRTSGQNTLLFMTIKRALLSIYDSAIVGGTPHEAYFASLGMRRDRIFTGYDAVDNAHFERMRVKVRGEVDSYRSKFNLPPRYIMNLGRFVPKKDLGTLVDAYAIIRQRKALPGFQLVLVGDGPERASLLERAERHGIRVLIGGESLPPGEQLNSDGYVMRVYPFMQNEDTPVFFSLASLFVMPSKIEEWGLVVNEALACGCPVVASDNVGSAHDLVVPGLTGYQFSPGDSVELANSIIRLCETLAVRRWEQACLKHVAKWGPRRFGTASVAACFAALQISIPRTPTGRVLVRQNVTFLQTCCPDYRAPVFENLRGYYGVQFSLLSGTDYFTSGLHNVVLSEKWHRVLANRYLAGRAFLWQLGGIDALLSADIVVMEMNPRIISSWFVLLARKFMGAPTIVWGHVWGRSGSAKPKNIIRLVMAKIATAVITYSRSQEVQLKRLLPGKRIFAAPNALLTEQDFRIAPHLLENKRTMLYVGRLIKSKNLVLLIRAFARISAQIGPGLSLCLVGDGPDREELEREAKAVSGTVEFLGHLTDKARLEDVYGSAICSVSPGYTGLSAIQAFSQGVPMVVSQRDDNAPEIEACVDGFNSRFFKRDSEPDLADLLKQMWLERELWTAKSAEIVEWTKVNYSIETMLIGFTSAIESING